MLRSIRNLIFTAFIFAIFVVVYLYRESNRLVILEFRGETMGTTYTIKYLDAKSRIFQTEVDTLLKQFNNALSTYQSNSEISKFNKDSTLTIQFKSNFIYPVLVKSRDVYEESFGYFDPTVAPLVNAWGFGFKTEKFPDSNRIKELKEIIGFDKIKFDRYSLTKTKKGVMLDFNAIAQGYGADVIAKYLEDKGISNYMIEVGGEVVCKGKNAKGEFWTIGINNPRYEVEVGSPYLKAKIQVDNKGVATSGNYRKYYYKEQKKYVHTIDPKTGYPKESDVLSATVLAPDAMTADAYATAFMVVGFEESKKILVRNPKLDAFLIYQDKNGKVLTYTSSNIEKMVILENIQKKQ